MYYPAVNVAIIGKFNVGQTDGLGTRLAERHVLGFKVHVHTKTPEAFSTKHLLRNYPSLVLGTNTYAYVCHIFL